MADYSDSAVVTIDGKDLDDVITDIELGGDASSKPVMTLNKRRRARGFKHGSPSFDATLTVEPIVDPTLPSWEQLRDTKKKFQIMFKPNNGALSEHLVDCVVVSVRRKASDGDGSFTVKIVFLDKK